MNNISDNSLKILVAEDSEFNQLMIEEILKKLEYNYTLVDNGKKVLDELSENKYNLVLMDVEMPVMSGNEALIQIRNSQNQNIPIIALTAHKEKHLFDDLMQIGYNHVLTKPFNLKDLNNILIEHLCIDNDIIQEETFIADDKLYNLDYIKEFSSNDDAFIFEMIDLFLQEAPISLNKLRDIKKTKNFEAVHQVAHKYTPQLNFMGLKTIIEHVDNLERLVETSNSINTIINEIEYIIKNSEKAMVQLKAKLNNAK